MNRGTVARIDTHALQHNLHTLKQQAPNSRIWAVVKADAYGHGALTCAQALIDLQAPCQADGFAVATLQEAKALRQAGVAQPILLLEGVSRALELSQAVALDLTLMIHASHQVGWLQALPDNNRIALILKVDTGMHRLGVAPEEVDGLVRLLSDMPQVRSLGICSHFACSDQKAHPMNQQQMLLFSRCAPDLHPRSLANSGAVWNFPESQLDWIRPGIALYGASPLPDTSAEALGLLPVMHLTAPVIAERWVNTGEPLGYGCHWRADRLSRIATLALGYADGYPRHAPTGTPVWIKGQIVPLVGRVSMDMMTIDVTDVPDSCLHSSAELWGAHLPVDEVARAVGTIGYELLTRVSPRVPRL